MNFNLFQRASSLKLTKICNHLTKYLSNCAEKAADKNEILEKRRQEIMSRGLPKVKPIPDVKDIILVSSGKGGVGKSTTSVNLAAALKINYPDKQIALLDTDVFGPSIPLMMNLQDTPLLNDNNLMEPLTNYGIKCMSMGFLVEESAAIIWRGLMVMQAMEKLMRQVEWGPTDILIVDTPPGTGDTQLSLVQNLPITGVILVTTPQAASIQVTRRGAKMFSKLNIPVIGLVENMSSVKCPACRNDVQLFGNDVSELAEELDTKILQRIPLQKEINNSSDKGVPIPVSKPNSPESNSYKDLAKQLCDYIDEIK